MRKHKLTRRRFEPKRAVRCGSEVIRDSGKKRFVHVSHGEAGNARRAPGHRSLARGAQRLREVRCDQTLGYGCEGRVVGGCVHSG